MSQLFWSSLLGTTVTGAIILTANTAHADLSPPLFALEFELPQDAVPQTSVGGGVRGKVEFTLPSKNASPNTSVGTGVRGKVQFALPDQEPTPKNTKSAGVRGDVEFAFPEQNSIPRVTVGSGVRGEEIPLTALVPTTKFGRTVSARPTIFVYLPPIGAEEVFFSIQDEAGNTHYHTMLKVPATGGVISISLPESAPELELGKNYLWYFAPIKPGDILRPDNYAVTGWIKRVATNINQQELASSEIELATEYAKAGIWYNTLEVLVKAHKANPHNPIFTSELQDLFEQVKLEASVLDQI